MAAKNEQRVSQLMSTFGPGAMLDLPTRSVIIGGLDQWEMSQGTWTSISEPRLTAALERSLRKNGRWSADKPITLRTPPLDPGDRSRIPAGIKCAIFPTWFVCVDAEAASKSAPNTRRRRLVRWNDLRPEGGRTKFETEDRKKVDVTPIRFVCGCRKGHLQDIDWRYAVHGAGNCHEPMWLEERGTSADPADTVVICGCGAKLSMEQAFIPQRLGRCKGARPWLAKGDPSCGEPLKFLTRTATNTYFPQVATAISLPVGEDELTKIVVRHLDDLQTVGSPEMLAIGRTMNAKLREALKGYSDSEVLARVRQILEGGEADANAPLKLAEFDVFASGNATIGTDSQDAKLFAKTALRSEWMDEAHQGSLDAIKNLVVVHRLREVVCLYGFTRFEPAPVDAESDLEDIRFAVDGAPITDSPEWLPAAEQFGEGLFLHFDEAAIAEWVTRPKVSERWRELQDAHTAWKRKKGDSALPFPGAPYVLLHSLSHALMSEIALDCGYPASSLKERIYAIPPGDGKAGRYGILIYTATAGAQGTLGGLIGATRRISSIIASALDRLSICSNDPVCADHEPRARDDDSALHGAACHSCLFAPEPSCESRNLFLDRTLLVPTMVGRGSNFFAEV